MKRKYKYAQIISKSSTSSIPAIVLAGIQDEMYTFRAHPISQILRSGHYCDTLSIETENSEQFDINNKFWNQRIKLIFEMLGLNIEQEPVISCFE